MKLLRWAGVKEFLRKRKCSLTEEAREMLQQEVVDILQKAVDRCKHGRRIDVDALHHLKRRHF